MNVKKKPDVLCVDDDEMVLEGMKDGLRRHFNITCASSAEEALNIINEGKRFAVIISDMQMAGMDGAGLLSQMKKLAPNTVRILLTGQAQMEAAMRAINDGQIFRFLMKPCDREHLISTLDQAVTHHRLLIAEKELLAKTLKGCVKTLIDVLQISNPLAMGRSQRMRSLVLELCAALNICDHWHLEVTALLSQLGALTLNDDLARSYYRGEKIAEAELEELASMKSVPAKLIESIPRMEKVIDMLNGLRDGHGSFDVHLVRLTEEYDILLCSGMTEEMALTAFKGRADYPAVLIEALWSIKHRPARQNEICMMAARSVEMGMVFAEDLFSTSGALLVAKGCEVNQSLWTKLQNLPTNSVREPVRMLVVSEES